MDKSQKVTDLIIALNQYEDGGIDDSDLIAAVCEYYDLIKSAKLSKADLKFLHHIACRVGIPHYFDLLPNFGNDNAIEGINMGAFSSALYESTLHTSKETKLHKYQKRILDKFSTAYINRFFLSASTSFGKTHLVYEIIKKMNYRNIVLIFPSVALLSENLEKLVSDPEYSNIKSTYKIHTLSDAQELGDRNIFIYTPERFLSFIEKQINRPYFDMAFIDEVYKIDNSYILDREEVKEDERDVSYRIAAFYALLEGADVLLAGPYIEAFSASFQEFLSSNKFKVLDFNKYEIVAKSLHTVKTRKKLILDEKIEIDFDSTNKKPRLKQMVTEILGKGENCIIYCSTQPSAEAYAKYVSKGLPLSSRLPDYQDFILHLEKVFPAQWCLIESLKKGVGIHHGAVPKYIQKEIIHLFNKGCINVLASTTTITEGVNTSAKNLIVTSTYKGDTPLRRFDARNIAGRAGRFLQHYKGRVIALQNDFYEVYNQEKDDIHHKNYDLKAPKDEVDLFYTEDKFLSPDDLARKQKVEVDQASRDIPEDILEQFKVVSRTDKITVYDNIRQLRHDDLVKIRKLVSTIAHSGNIEWEGFETVLKIILPIVKIESLKFFMATKASGGSSNFSLLTVMIWNYLKAGLRGMVDYNITERDLSIDESMRKSTRFVFNMLRYQVVKYLGVFNLMYKLHQSKSADDMNWRDAPGIDKLLLMLEYNAVTEKGKMASDYGVPASVLRYYEVETNQAPSIRQRFDKYEEQIFNKTQKILSE